MDNTQFELSLERIVPDEVVNHGPTGEESLRLHLARYRWAVSRQLAGSGIDMACGVGYGCDIIARECPNVSHLLGVDIDPSALAYARSRYAHPKISFLQSDVCELSLSDSVDFIVSLETIEHVQDPNKLVERFRELLTTDGFLVASVPITPSTDGNPYHVSDFSLRSFRKLLSSHGFKELGVFIQEQPFQGSAVIDKSNPRLESLLANLARSYRRKPSLLLRRILASIQHGFKNKYATIHCVKQQ